MSSVRGESPISGGGDEIMLFGVRVKVDPMRKSASLNNLSDYEPVVNVNANVNNNSSGNLSNNNSNTTDCELAKSGGYVSADDAVPQPSNGGRDRKRGVPWTEDEHKLFLIGLQKVGKGDWRGISRNYVKTRTPTQVASHAQKYFLRRTNFNRRRRRSSLFDITTDSVPAVPTEEGQNRQNSPAQPVPQPTTVPQAATPNANGFSVVPFPMTVGSVLVPMQSANPMENPANNSSTMLVCPIPVFPMPTYSTMVDLNLNHQMPFEPSQFSLNLSLSSGQDHSSSARNSAFQVIPSFKNRDSTVTVA